ncbi:MAG: hypothetical protein HY735_33105, partial [Verrucomicrobia bacterium]|nr:hypothetical protein [Verrucomicrobiota bacterium]
MQRRFVYDGWNVLVELDGSNNVVQRYVWGMDLSGSVQGAGGVGGLVAVKSSSGVAHFAAMDGNENVMGLVEGSTGLVSANYEYGPFGEPIRISGTQGKANPFRWSTKFTDDETDLVYYGHRYYNPSTGRFLSRDPIEEKGGPNLYAFVSNNPIDSVDAFGLIQEAPINYIPDATKLGVPWAIAETQGPWVAVISKEDCTCGARITKAVVRLQITIRKLGGIPWDQKDAVRMTVLQHELQHAKIFREHATKVEKALQELVGPCRRKECMDATNDYITYLQQYYLMDEGYANANFDCHVYPTGHPARVRCDQAREFKRLRDSYKKDMDESRIRMGRLCE